MDFITALHRSQNQFDLVWIIVDRMTKFAHFLLVRKSFLVEDYVRLYLYEIVKLHGLPISIILDYSTQFSSNFQKSFQKGLGTKVSLTTAFYPHSDRQAERLFKYWNICFELV